MNFGGVNGELLRDVASISILKNSVPFRNDKECIFGVRVAYRNPDKQPAFIGDGQCRNVREMTIYLDGPGGERITQIHKLFVDIPGRPKEFVGLRVSRQIPGSAEALAWDSKGGVELTSVDLMQIHTNRRGPLLLLADWYSTSPSMMLKSEVCGFGGGMLVGLWAIMVSLQILPAF
jgi:hypothetical protein